MPWRGSGKSNRRGATIVLVAVVVAVILGMAAISVDLAMLMKMRSDAQRTADAAALAGASAYLTGDALAARPLARDRALEYAARNYVGGTNVDTSGQTLAAAGSNWTVTTNEATVEIAPAIYRVRVTIRRPDASTLFGRIFGVYTTPIQAYAAAEAVDAGGSGCVMPFGISDLWDEQTPAVTTGPTPQQGPAQDANGNRVQDEAERWTFDPATGDRYVPYNPGVVDPTQTGYGSDWRNGNGQGVTDDYGRQVLLKPQSPQDAPGPGNFHLWGFTDDEAGRGGEGGVFDRIRNCDPRNVMLGSADDHVVISGNSVSIRAPITELINLDPGASWNPSTRTVQGSGYGAGWINSPRVVKVALFSPYQLAGLGNRQPIVFNNIAMFFLEGFVAGSGPQGQDNIVGRFLYYASGSHGGTTGALVKTLRLVE